MLSDLYYKIRPFIPRRCQIALRRAWVQQRKKNFTHIWPIDENAAGQPKGWKGWPGKKQFSVVLTHDIESARGQDRCLDLMRLERKLGFKSSFNFVAEKYANHVGLFEELRKNGCEIGLHGLQHHDNLFKSYTAFAAQVPRINKYLREWGATGFRTPCMYHKLDWIHELAVEYDASTFDTDPFEPEPDGVGTIFPFRVARNNGDPGYIELPYTLPQDFTLFILMQEKGIEIWKQKIDWIAKHKGMALLITHPDYMTFHESKREVDEYPVRYYQKFLDYIQDRYNGQFWNPLPREMASFWKEKIVDPATMNRR